VTCNGGGFKSATSNKRDSLLSVDLLRIAGALSSVMSNRARQRALVVAERVDVAERTGAVRALIDGDRVERDLIELCEGHFSVVVGVRIRQGLESRDRFLRL